jgi:hypothetical protein
VSRERVVLEFEELPDAVPLSQRVKRRRQLQG